MCNFEDFGRVYGKSVFLPKNKYDEAMNEQNLIPFNERSESEVREMNAKGGVKSGEVRREKATFRLEYSALLDMFARMGDAELVKLKEEWGLDKVTNRQCIVAASVELARRPTAAGTAERRLIYDNMGEMTNKMEVQLSPYEYLAKVRELRENE